MIASPKINIPPALMATLTETQEDTPTVKSEKPRRKRKTWDMRFTLLMLCMLFGVNFLLLSALKHMPLSAHTDINEEIAENEAVAQPSSTPPQKDDTNANYRPTEIYVFNKNKKAKILQHIKHTESGRSLDDPLNLQVMKKRTLERIIERKRIKSLTAEELSAQ